MGEVGGLSEVVAQHRWDTGGPWGGCTCGWRSEDVHGPDRELPERWTLWSEHVAATIARAAAPDALRERVEALAAEWERDARGIPRTMSQVSEGVRAAMNGCARDLRAALAETVDGADA